MKPKVIRMTEDVLIEGCRKNDRRSQRHLYEKYFDPMSLVCYRYLKDRDLAHEMVHEGFIKVFKAIHQYKNQGSLEGWIRRIMVNTCLDHLRKEKKFRSQVEISEAYDLAGDENHLDQMEAEDVLLHIQSLPEPLGTVFNLYIIEGYSHKEIAQKLGFGASTSRAYLTEARKKLRLSLASVQNQERRVNHG